jgi:hypothetical protein
MVNRKTMSDTPPFLIQQEPRLSIKEAEKIVDDILARLNGGIASKEKKDQFIIKNQGTERRKEEVF